MWVRTHAHGTYLGVCVVRILVGASWCLWTMHPGSSPSSPAAFLRLCDQASQLAAIPQTRRAARGLTFRLVADEQSMPGIELVMIIARVCDKRSETQWMNGRDSRSPAWKEPRRLRYWMCHTLG